ncbi:MAG TPA: hypothetical protein VKA84_10435 [Gemmatimonadaceae bacterium]|nr:hypothetical protein [Gemmatimonadaceae bacterium]
MSTSEPRSHVALTLRAADPATEITVLNREFEPRARGTGQLTVWVAPDVYKVKLRTGTSVHEELVLVPPGSGEILKEYDDSASAFPSPAPLANTTTASAEHVAAAERESRLAHAPGLGSGSSIFVFARDWTPPGRPPFPPGATPHPARGLSLVSHGATAGDARLVDFEAASAGPPGGTWAACNVRLSPGAYRLRLSVPDGESMEQTVIASPGWQTQVFLLQREYAKKKRRRGHGHEHGDPDVPRDPDALRADLAGAAVLLARGEGFTADDRGARLTELARLALVGRRRLAAAVRALLPDRIEHPMLGIFAAHLLLAEERPDARLILSLVRRLRELLGASHPDVTAVALAAGESAPPGAFTVPPMLRASWSIVANATVERPELVPAESFCSAMAARILRYDPWLLWRVRETPAWSPFADDPPPTGLVSAIEAYLAPNVGGEAPVVARVAGQGVLHAQAASLGEAQVRALVKSLDLPRAKVEQLVGQVEVARGPAARAASRSAPPAPGAGGADDYAIVVGINRYPALVDLEGPERDARAFRDWLLDSGGGAVPAEHVRLLVSSDHPPAMSPLDAKPTAAMFYRECAALMQVAARNAEEGLGRRIGRRLYLYMSGHGIAPSFDETALLMANATVTQTGYHVPGRLVAEHFRAAAYFDEVLLFMDCARERTPRATLAPVPFTAVYGPPPLSPRWFYAFSSKWGLISVERRIGGEVRGVFSAALLAGLRGGAAAAGGQITAASLASYLYGGMKAFLDLADLENVDLTLEPEVSYDPSVGDEFVIARVPDLEFPVTITFAEAARGQRAEVRSATLDAIAETTAGDAPWRLSLRPGLYLATAGAAQRPFEVRGPAETRLVL